MKYFGTDGIRGHVNSKNINGDMFFKFGLAAGKYFTNLKKKKQTAIIAKDTRLSGYALEPALVSATVAYFEGSSIAVLTWSIVVALPLHVICAIPSIEKSISA